MDKLADAEGELRDQVVPEAVAEAVENFFAAIADDFTQPGAAVDGDEEGPVTQAGRLRVRDDIGIEQVVPDLDDFGLGPAFIDAQAGENAGQNL